MNDVVFALITVGAGALFCVRGRLAFRIVIPIVTAAADPRCAEVERPP